MTITPPRPVDVAAVLPGIHARARRTTRLHPRPGRPAPTQSSLGGPLLWPAGEPWPVCPEPATHADLFAEPLRAGPLIPVLQLFAVDVPGVPFPEGTDLLQLLWCPTEHEADDMFDRPWTRMTPVCRVFWRDSAAGDLVGPRHPGGPVPDGEFVPRPCVLRPEVVADYPHVLELTPDELAEVADSEVDYDQLGPAPGTKVGGWVEWAQESEVPSCDQGHEMAHLVTVASVEDWEDSWTPAPDAARNPSGLMLADCGGYHVFTCAHCPDRPVVAVTQ